jgi:hypothetical protein
LQRLGTETTLYALDRVLGLVEPDKGKLRAAMTGQSSNRRS